jgi:hypothetical protein
MRSGLQSQAGIDCDHRPCCLFFRSAAVTQQFCAVGHSLHDRFLIVLLVEKTCVALH